MRPQKRALANQAQHPIIMVKIPENSRSCKMSAVSQGVMLALGRARQVKSRKYFNADVNLPAFLQEKAVKPFINNDLVVTSSRRLP